MLCNSRVLAQLCLLCHVVSVLCLLCLRGDLCCVVLCCVFGVLDSRVVVVLFIKNFLELLCNLRSDSIVLVVPYYESAVRSVIAWLFVLRCVFGLPNAAVVLY